MRMSFLRASVLVSLGLLACVKPPSEEQEAAEQAAPADPTDKAAEPAKPPITAENDPGLKPTTEPLTAEEERLIAADPASLTPDERRARAHALRKKIMMNPDSPQAQALEDARAAALAGQVTAPEPKATEDTSLVLELPPHLREKQAAEKADATKAPAP